MSKYAGRKSKITKAKKFLSLANSISGGVIWKAGTYYRHPTSILMTGSPRSGTTWVLELLETIPRTRRVWEPFLSPSTPSINSIRNFGLGFRPYLPSRERHIELESFFTNLLDGKIFNYSHLRNNIYPLYNNTKRLLTAETTFIKFCRAQRLLPWISNWFPKCKKALLFRNPIAVVASQLFHSGFKHIRVEDEHPVISEKIYNDYPELSEYSLNLSTLEEKLTATWCFDYFIPLKNWTDCKNTFLLIYENLVREPEKELGHLGDYLQMKFPKRTYDRINKPSTTTVKDSNVLKNKNPLTTWKTRLTKKQIKRILKVIDRFGINFLGDDLNLNTNKIQKFINKGFI